MMRWLPGQGHVPRGFCGATGAIEDVKLVLVTAEPGNPHGDESYSGSPEQMFDAAYTHAYDCLKDRTDVFHKKLRLILSLCFPGTDLAEQLRLTWITDSVLCSAPIESGPIPIIAACECRSRYLERQLSLFPEAVIATIGAKARNRLAGIEREVMRGAAAAPPACHYRGARESWEAIARRVQEKFG